MKLVLTVILLAGLAFAATTDPFDRVSQITNNAMDALEEYVVMTNQLLALHDPKVNAVLSSELPKIQAKLRGTKTK